MKAFLAVDPQRDFCERGALAVRGGNSVAVGIRRHLLFKESDYITRIVTHDWHIDPGTHWSDNPDFVDSWPRHCAFGTLGAELHPSLVSADLWEYRVFKGQFKAAYSGFEGSTLGTTTTLLELLKRHEITQVDIGGLALDYCVKATALDAVKHGFKTTVLADLTAAVHNDRKSVRENILEMQKAGVEFR